MNQNQSDARATVIILITIVAICLAIISVVVFRYLTTRSVIYNDLLETSGVSNTNSTMDKNISINASKDTSASSFATSNNVKSSSLDQPLAINEWGLAGKYISGEYVDVPVRITKISRGNNLEATIKNWLDNQSIYKYETPEDGLEWAIVNYQIDLSNVDLSSYVDAEVTSDIKGADGYGVKYNGYSYILSTINASDKEAIKNAGVYDSQFITQLPKGCTDYLIQMGSTYQGAGSEAYFRGE